MQHTKCAELRCTDGSSGVSLSSRTFPARPYVYRNLLNLLSRVVAHVACNSRTFITNGLQFSTTK